MAALDADQLVELEDAVIDNLTYVLSKKNADGTLERLLDEMGLSHLLSEVAGIPEKLKTWREGKILVVGAPEKMKTKLLGAAKAMGLGSHRLEFIACGEATNYAFNHLEWSPKWCAVLFGASPHSAKGKGNDSSILTHLESHRERYPEVRRLISGGRLKITLTNFKEVIGELISVGVIEPE